MAKGGIVNQVVTILDEDLERLVGTNKLKRKEIMGALKEYLEEEDLIDPSDGRYFKADGTIKALFKEIGVKSSGKIARASLLKLFGGDAKEAGLVEY